MSKIKNIVARQIFDSRGNPTVEADVITSNGVLGKILKVFKFCSLRGFNR